MSRQIGGQDGRWQQAAGKAGRQAYGQAGRWAGTRVCIGQVGIQVGRQASFEPAEGRLQRLVC